MEIEYPSDFVSDYPIVLRKAAKLLIAIDDDREYPDDAEWVPERIAFDSPGKWWVDEDGATDLDVEQHTVTCDGNSLRVWFRSFRLDQKLLIQQFGSGSGELNEEMLDGWVSAVEKAITDISGAAAVESIYADTQLLDSFERDTNINESFKRPMPGQAGFKKVAAKKVAAKKR